MKKSHKKIQKHVRHGGFVFVILILLFIVAIMEKGPLDRLLFHSVKVLPPVATQSPSVPPPRDTSHDVVYQGTIYHIFFHSLIVYPELAFQNDEQGRSYGDYMVTRDAFVDMLNKLYANNFVLIDLKSIYHTDEAGNITAQTLRLPPGKKPLIISLDDLSYYSTMKGRGFAEKLVLDSQGEVATEIETPDHRTIITRTGDVVPILDDFVKLHPDFSLDGSKGVIAVTGFEGILGYRTQGASTTLQQSERVAVKPVVEKLKSTGWRFASHSYSHIDRFRLGEISLQTVAWDAQKWNDEVRSLVGDTDIFIGPFGQVFPPGDPRREYILSQGFKILCGVGMDLYLHYFPTYVVMNRADIDGYRVTHNPAMLKVYFGSEKVTY